MTIVKSDGCTTRLCPTFHRNEATEKKDVVGVEKYYRSGCVAETTEANAGQ